LPVEKISAQRNSTKAEFVNGGTLIGFELKADGVADRSSRRFREILTAHRGGESNGSTHRAAERNSGLKRTASEQLY
jgi:hypothetical protein